MKILITILILFFPILGEFITKFITKEWDDITDFLLIIPPFNIISAIKKYYGENIIINYNSIFIQVGGLFIVTIIGTIALIYMYLNDNNLFTIENINFIDNIDENNKEINKMSGGNFQKINKNIFNKFYI
tara:strand:- start:481 stop:870 length:390 start_codon:yes stop_codon:yes gene_type:complete